MLTGSCCLTTVPITDAMQMTVSSEMENRIDDNNSTVSLTMREPVRMCRPWVETVMEKWGKTVQQKGRFQ
ncbi:hypothetical protein D9M69_596170 [compost metagenome]